MIYIIRWVKVNPGSLGLIWIIRCRWNFTERSSPPMRSSCPSGICDQDPPQRRTRQSTVRKKQWERCVRMTTKLAKWASEHDQIIKSRLSYGHQAKSLPSEAGLAYDWLRFNDYLGKPGVFRKSESFPKLGSRGLRSTHRRSRTKHVFPPLRFSRFSFSFFNCGFGPAPPDSYGGA